MEAPVAIFGKANDGQWYPIGIEAPVAATQTLTLVAAPTDGDTVTVGGKTYTFQDTLTNVANNVKNNVSAGVALDNLIAAINRDPGDGTLYATATVQNTQVSAAADTGDTMVVTARRPGYAGNSIATTEDFTNAGNVWGATTLTGGLEARQKVDLAIDETGLATSAKQDTMTAEIDKTIPGTTAGAVTPSDSTVLTSRAVWVGTGGDLSVRLSGAPSTTVVFANVPDGSLLPISVTRVMAATTASDVVVIN